METTSTIATIAETVAETISESVPAETVNQVIEAAETVDYSAIQEQILTSVRGIESATLLLSSFALFAVVVCLCYFCYKFFKIFF